MFETETHAERSHQGGKGAHEFEVAEGRALADLEPQAARAARRIDQQLPQLRREGTVGQRSQREVDGACAAVGSDRGQCQADRQQIDRRQQPAARGQWQPARGRLERALFAELHAQRALEMRDRATAVEHDEFRQTRTALGQRVLQVAVPALLSRRDCGAAIGIDLGGERALAFSTRECLVGTGEQGAGAVRHTVRPERSAEVHDKALAGTRQRHAQRRGHTGGCLVSGLRGHRGRTRQRECEVGTVHAASHRALLWPGAQHIGERAQRAVGRLTAQVAVDVGEIGDPDQQQAATF